MSKFHRFWLPKSVQKSIKTAQKSEQKQDTKKEAKKSEKRAKKQPKPTSKPDLARETESANWRRWLRAAISCELKFLMQKL